MNLKQGTKILEERGANKVLTSKYMMCINSTYQMPMYGRQTITFMFKQNKLIWESDVTAISPVILYEWLDEHFWQLCRLLHKINIKLSSTFEQSKIYFILNIFYTIFLFLNNSGKIWKNTFSFYIFNSPPLPHLPCVLFLSTLSGYEAE